MNIVELGSFSALKAAVEARLASGHTASKATDRMRTLFGFTTLSRPGLIEYLCVPSTRMSEEDLRTWEATPPHLPEEDDGRVAAWLRRSIGTGIVPSDADIEALRDAWASELPSWDVEPEATGGVCVFTNLIR